MEAGGLENRAWCRLVSSSPVWKAQREAWETREHPLCPHSLDPSQLRVHQPWPSSHNPVSDFLPDSDRREFTANLSPALWALDRGGIYSLASQTRLTHRKQLENKTRQYTVYELTGTSVAAKCIIYITHAMRGQWRKTSLLAGVFSGKVLRRRWTLGSTLKEKTTLETGGSIQAGASHEPSPRGESDRTRGPLGVWVDGAWFPQPWKSLNSSPFWEGGCRHSISFSLEGKGWGLLLKPTLSSCCWQILEVMGKPEVGMIFALRGAPWVKLGLWESIPSELPAATSEELIHSEHVALFQCRKLQGQESGLVAGHSGGPANLYLAAELGSRREDYTRAYLRRAQASSGPVSQPPWTRQRGTLRSRKKRGLPRKWVHAWERSPSQALQYLSRSGERGSQISLMWWSQSVHKTEGQMSNWSSYSKGLIAFLYFYFPSWWKHDFFFTLPRDK